MPKGVYIRSVETSQKLREARLGMSLPPETRAKISKSKKGVKPSDDAVEKRRLAITQRWATKIRLTL